MTKRISYPAEFKALPGGKGKVEALVSVFGNVDVQGDRVMPGAFKNTIDEWGATGDPVPVVFSHDWGDVWSHIGVVDSLEETDKGLKAAYTLDVDDNPVAAQIYRLMKRRTLKEHSFAYDVRKEKRAKDGANELLDLGLIELGPTLKGANPSTELLAVKSALQGDEKVYGTVEGSMEEAQRRIADALKEQFGAEDVWTWIVATYADRLVYSRESQDGPTEYFEVAYDVDEDSVTFGEPSAVELATEVREKAGRRVLELGPGFEEKAGRRISQATESELRTRITALRAEIDAIEGLLPSEDSEDTEKTDVAPQPEGPGTDDELLRLRLAIEAAR